MFPVGEKAVFESYGFSAAVGKLIRISKMCHFAYSKHFAVGDKVVMNFPVVP